MTLTKKQWRIVAFAVNKVLQELVSELTDSEIEELVEVEALLEDKVGLL